MCIVVVSGKIELGRLPISWRDVRHHDNILSQIMSLWQHHDLLK